MEKHKSHGSLLANISSVSYSKDFCNCGLPIELLTKECTFGGGNVLVFIKYEKKK